MHTTSYTSSHSVAYFSLFGAAASMGMKPFTVHEVHYLGRGGFIAFDALMVKINNGTRNTLIGTDGADSFDASNSDTWRQRA